MGKVRNQDEVDAKQCLSISTVASSKSCLDPEFLKAIPIMKTRSGMQVCVYVPGSCGCTYSTPALFICFCFVYVTYMS